MHIFCTNRALVTGEDMRSEVFHLPGGRAHTCTKRGSRVSSSFRPAPSQLAGPGGPSQAQWLLLILSLAPVFSPQPPEIAPLK